MDSAATARGGGGAGPRQSARPRSGVQLVTDSIPRALGIPADRDPGRHAGAPRPGRHHRAEPGAEGDAQPGTGRARRLRPGRPGGGGRQPPRRGVRQRRGRHVVSGPVDEGSWSRSPTSPVTVSRQAARRPAARLGDHRAPGSGFGIAGRGRGASARGHQDAVPAAGLHRADPGRSGTCRWCTAPALRWPGRSVLSASGRGRPGWPACCPATEAGDRAPARRAPRRGRRPAPWPAPARSGNRSC